MRLFKAINRGPTLYEAIMAGLGRNAALQNGYNPAARPQYHEQQQRPLVRGAAPAHPATRQGPFHPIAELR